MAQLAQNLVFFWLGAMIVLLLIEAAVPGLVSIWFAAGALVAALAAICKAPMWLQLIVFAAVSGATLVFTRPLVKKYVNSKAQPTNFDMVIGKECIVTERIDNIRGTGAVKVDGKIWTALSPDGSVIEEGQRAEVKEIKGVKLVVAPFETNI